MWKLLHGFLPFPDRVQKFGFNLPSVCPFCWNQSATLEHCMWHCSCAKDIWSFFANLLNINLSLATSVRSVCQLWWLADFSANSHASLGNVSICIRNCIPVFVLWSLWKNYNILIHEGGHYSRDCIIREVKRDFFDLSIAHPFRQVNASDSRFIHLGFVAFFATPRPKKTLWIKWLRPPSGRLKLNSDASFSTFASGGGAVLRNSQGGFVAALAFPFLASCALEAEAKALALAMRWCNLVARKPLSIEVDSSVLVNLILNCEAPIPWKLRSSIVTIRYLLSDWNATITHSYREANTVADALASFGCSLSHSSLYSTFNSLPSAVRMALLLRKLPKKGLCSGPAYRISGLDASWKLYSLDR
ncbi:uncharacterized protein LOC116032326 [Ipomoea triloba]|uniref:uncharacterized protein LOC116032326 n=1 Tax=Ipomoea triloba TaxID=35885 RepID=UPI00125DBC20|nr:uncharacterized protein LOC116032326 [Ipomoea triloba]